jgi:hypothetical protein
MEPSRTILIKRRLSGTSGPPSTLKNGELAFNEVDQVLYYGKGNNNGSAINIIPIAGNYTSIFKDATVETLSSGEATASQDYLIINVNGSVRALRLFDF